MRQKLRIENSVSEYLEIAFTKCANLLQECSRNWTRSWIIKSMKGVGGDSQKVEAIDKGHRGLRWTKHETLTLVAAKKREIEKTLDHGTATTTAVQGIDSPITAAAADVKWVTVFQYCKQFGVDRDASQCRKRWHSLYKEYRKIKDHENTYGTGSYWSMSAELRRENKLAASFEHDVFEAFEIYCQRMPPLVAPKHTFNSVVVSSDHKRKSSNLLPDVGLQEGVADLEDLQTENGDGGDDDEVGIYHHPMGKRKKKRQRESVEEQLISVLEKSSQDLQQHLSLDRELRKEQARGLVEVLNKLVDVIGTMAEAMQRR